MKQICNETTRFINHITTDQLVNQRTNECEQCHTKYGTAVNFAKCPHCGRTIIEYVFVKGNSNEQ